MSFVAINVITVPEGGGAGLEARFASRAGSVDTAPGFEHFELLRPVAGTNEYLVYTRWASEGDFENWRDSRDFRASHKGGGGSGESSEGSGPPGGATAAAAPSDRRPSLWTFEVV